jgi:hypothetical protein
MFQMFDKTPRPLAALLLTLAAGGAMAGPLIELRVAGDDGGFDQQTLSAGPASAFAASGNGRNAYFGSALLDAGGRYDEILVNGVLVFFSAGGVGAGQNCDARQELFGLGCTGVENPNSATTQVQRRSLDVGTLAAGQSLSFELKTSVRTAVSDCYGDITCGSSVRLGDPFSLGGAGFQWQASDAGGVSHVPEPGSLGLGLLGLGLLAGQAWRRRRSTQRSA